jgi:hypothetical protein
MRVLRWMLLLAAVHTWSGLGILAAVAAAAIAELARDRWIPRRFV